MLIRSPRFSQSSSRQFFDQVMERLPEFTTFSVHSEYRRQGFGTTMLINTLQNARHRRYKKVILGTSEQGYNLYLRLGFQHVCTFKFYELGV